MIVFKHNYKSKGPPYKRINCAFATLMKAGASKHSRMGTYLIPLLNMLECKGIAYKLSAIPNRHYLIELIAQEKEWKEPAKNSKE